MTPTQAALDLTATTPPPPRHTGLFRAYSVSNVSLNAPKGCTMRQRFDEALETHRRHGHPRPTLARMHADDAASLGPVDGIAILTDVVVARNTIYLERPE